MRQIWSRDGDRSLFFKIEREDSGGDRKPHKTHRLRPILQQVEWKYSILHRQFEIAPKLKPTWEPVEWKHSLLHQKFDFPFFLRYFQQLFHRSHSASQQSALLFQIERQLFVWFEPPKWV